MRLRALACVAALLGASVATNAAAETPPSAWDRAKRPELRDEYELHLTVQRIVLMATGDIPGLAMMSQPQLVRALAMLQAAKAETSPNPLLRFDLGYVYRELDNFPRAVAVWKGVMRDFPDYHMSRQQKLTLAVACGKIADHECEEKIYREVLALEGEPAHRTQPLGNLAETDMHNHDLKEAIEEYREVIRLCGKYQAGWETPSLALWGLAVALDRSGESREAQKTAGEALAMAGNKRAIIDLAGTQASNAFFVPDYEVGWYQALTSVAQANAATTPYERLAHWQNAETFMRKWVKGGEAAKDYWLPIAKTRLASYEAERRRAEVKVAKEAPRVVPGHTIINL